MTFINCIASGAFNANSSGTVDFVYGSDYAGYVNPVNGGIPDGTAVNAYYAESADGLTWEYGRAVYTYATNSLGRSPLLTSLGNTSKVNFASPPVVFVFGWTPPTSFFGPSPVDAFLGPPPTQNALAGLVLSTAGSSSTFSVAKGAAADTFNLVNIVLASAMSKTTGAWVAGTGNGALDTGSIANNTWYHVFVIFGRGKTDILVSLSISAPTLPTGYGYIRRIGSMKTDGSAHWVAFTQVGDDFLWAAFVQDVNTSSWATANTNYTLTVPTGLSVLAKISFEAWDDSLGDSTPQNFWGLIYSPLLGTLTVNSSGNNANVSAGQGTPTAGAAGGNGVLAVQTNTSAQVSARSTYNSGFSHLIITTTGWTDTRGKTT